MSQIKFREYKSFPFPASVTPLIEGVTPTKENIKKHSKTFDVRDKETGHVLTAREWSGVVGDNIVQFGVEPTPKSRFKITDLEFRTIDADGNVIEDWQ